MGTNATTVNDAATGVNKALKGLLDLGLSSLEVLLDTSVPWTALPVLKQIRNALLSWIETKFYEEIAEDGTYLVIKFQTTIEKSAYNTAVSDLKAAQIEGDPLKLQAAKLAWANSASSFIHSDGSANP